MEVKEKRRKERIGESNIYKTLAGGFQQVVVNSFDLPYLLSVLITPIGINSIGLIESGDEACNVLHLGQCQQIP